MASFGVLEMAFLLYTVAGEHGIAIAALKE
jgi:hypothetical protein